MARLTWLKAVKGRCSCCGTPAYIRFLLQGAVLLSICAWIVSPVSIFAETLLKTSSSTQDQTSSEQLREEIKKLEETINRFREVGDTKAEADALVRIATKYQRLNNYRSALDAYTKALSFYQADHDSRGEGAVLNGLGAVYGRLSNYPKSLESYEQALPIFRAEKDRNSEALALAGIGAALLRLNDYKKALKACHQALEIYRTLSDRAGEASTLQQIGYLHFVQDEYPQAFDAYDKALLLVRSAGDNSREAVLLQSIGRAHFRRGNFQLALDLYGQALSLERAAQNRSGEAVLLGAMGQVYRALGDNQKALDYLNRSLVVFRETGERLNEATSLNILAHVNLSVGDHQQALSLFKQSLEICQLISNRAGEASNTNGLGLAHAALGEYQKALEFHNKALELFRSIGHRRAEGDSLSHMGRAYLALGRYREALAHLSESLVLYRAVRALAEETRALYAIARTHQASGNLIEARAQIEAAIFLVEASRQGVASEQLRSSYLASVRDLYLLNIDILMELHTGDPSAGLDKRAFETSERARARSLLDLLAEARADIRQGVEPGLLEKERTVRQVVAARAERHTQVLNSKSPPDQLATVARELEAALSEYQDVQAEIKKNSPRYAALMQPEPVKLEHIQSDVLDNETALLEYFLGTKRSYLWVVTRDAIASYELPGSAEIEEKAREFYDLLKTKRNKEELEQTANLLSQMLLGPASDLLSKKRLAIAPDGALHYIPFAALPKPKRTSESQTAYQPLMLQHELVSLPSASTLAVLKQEMKGRVRAPNMIAVIADPVFDANDVRIRRSRTRPSGLAEENSAPVNDAALLRSVEDVGLAQGRWPLPRLLGTRREARAILSMAPVNKRRQALDFEASRETATAEDLATYQVIHFATHALINNQNPDLSGLVLSLVDKQGRSRDGFLRLNDIYNLRLPAELVVLSACQTGLGKEIRGEGLIGMTRGFMYAGTPRLLASLWQVDDKATSVLMGHFYRALLGDRKLGAAAALREAQMQMWQQKDWQSPYYWAAFTVQGEWN